MKKTMSLLFFAASTALFFCVTISAHAQKTRKPSSAPAELKVSFTADRWEGTSAGVEFLSHKNVPAMKLTGKERVILKDVMFADGTIEYDVEPQSEGFAG